MGGIKMLSAVARSLCMLLSTYLLTFTLLPDIYAIIPKTRTFITSHFRSSVHPDQ